MTAEFGEKGWKQLPDTIAKRYKFVPSKVEVDEQHIGVYASKADGHMVKAPPPKGLLHGSPVSPSLGAAIMNGKYVNAIPLYRMENEFERYGLTITRQNKANWMIRLGEEYRSGFMYTDRQIVPYEYQKTRNASHPRRFLKDYSGICVTDGYQIYHTLGKQLEDLKIGGCRVPARRRLDEAQKVLPEASRKESMSYLLMKQIQAIYREEGKRKDLTSEERLKQRQVIVKPLVDALFVYLKQHEGEVPGKGKLREGINYLLNQERYLKVFLTDGDVPIDNNASERAIRGFYIERRICRSLIR